MEREREGGRGREREGEREGERWSKGEREGERVGGREGGQNTHATVVSKRTEGEDGDKETRRTSVNARLLDLCRCVPGHASDRFDKDGLPEAKLNAVKLRRDLIRC